MRPGSRDGASPGQNCTLPLHQIKAIAGFCPPGHTSQMTTHESHEGSSSSLNWLKGTPDSLLQNLYILPESVLQLLFSDHPELKRVDFKDSFVWTWDVLLGSLGVAQRVLPLLKGAESPLISPFPSASSPDKGG